jgi:hypothetical protein
VKLSGVSRCNITKVSAANATETPTTASARRATKTANESDTPKARLDDHPVGGTVLM